MHRRILAVAGIALVATAVHELVPRMSSTRTRCIGTNVSAADLQYGGPMLVGPTMQALLFGPDRVGIAAGPGECVGREGYRVIEITNDHVSLSDGAFHRTRLFTPRY